LLHDYLFFATTERGKVAETGPFIHNYALTYAVGWATSPWYHEEQKPQYREELSLVGKRYITPAQLLRGSMIVSQYNTMSESYSMSKGRSIGYPDWGFIKCFRPGSVFRCYVLSLEEAMLPRFLRLGKFMAKTEMHVVQAEHVHQVQGNSQQAYAHKQSKQRRSNAQQPLLNWNDLAPGARPLAFDIIANALPSHLIANAASFDDKTPLLQAIFPAQVQRERDEREHIHIPLQMGYYGENLCISW
jgi:CRISPR type I-D-associated protein Csc1